MKKVLILGGGRIGAAIAHNLMSDHAVTIADLETSQLQHLTDSCQLVNCDVTDTSQLENLVTPFDVVVGALPSRLGYNALKHLIQLRKPIVDISFFAEDALTLKTLAQENQVTALVDFGLAPGLSNLFAGHCHATFDPLDTFNCMVGGLPVERTLPYQYKAPFAPLDVIEEYTRPARMRRAGADITLPALSEIERIHFDGVGDLEAFNTDGLRTLLQTIPVPNMAEKTIRYPGHVQLMQQLTDGGFFDSEHIEATAKVLLEHWQFKPQEADLTVMHMEAHGQLNNEPHSLKWQLVDHYDHHKNISSMARTTGYTCAAGVRLLLQEKLPTGVVPPEIIGQNKVWFDFILQQLKNDGVVFQSSTA
ncbi:saccharopine dehydrogenase family protein [Marinicella sp. W31]|uniref:saccharopine dehydrogenase family protein n=1 Tax=Marinicella sp. W31 TaxID=3023713 RepID=UPI0037569516